MFGKILTAIDNSTLGNQVFKQALTLAQAFNAQLLLLHVLSDEEVGYPDIRNLSDHLDQWEASKQTGLHLLMSHQQAAIAAGVQTSIAQAPGASGKTICETARSWQADVIVVGHRGLSGIQEMVRGSVSNYLVHHAPCAVLTLIGRAELSFQQILVAIDGSPISHRAFEQALTMAQTTGSKLHLLHVLSVEDQDSPSILSLRDANFERQWEVFAQPSLEMLRSHQAIARSAGVETEIHQKLGSNPGRVICDISHQMQADLIVIGRRGLSGLSEMLMGSVSNYVTHYSPCSVITVQGTHSNGSSVVEQRTSSVAN